VFSIFLYVFVFITRHLSAGWNKRSGSTKRERNIFKIRSAIDAYLDSPFAVSRCCMRDLFSCFRQSVFCFRVLIFLSAIMSTETTCCSFITCWWNRCACSTLRFYSVLNKAEQKIYKHSNSTIFPGRVRLSLTVMPLRREGWGEGGELL